MHTRPFRNRHGRGLRGPLVPRTIPRYRTRRAAFDVAVLEAYAPLAARYPEHLHGLDLAVDTVPRMRLGADLTVLPEDVIADGAVPLGRIIPAGVDSAGHPTRARLVVFRMPVEQRAATPGERADLLHVILTALVAYYLNIDPETIDPDFQW